MGIALKNETVQFWVRKLRRNVEDYGWPVAARKALAYPLRLIYFRQAYRIYRINLDAAPPRHALDTPGITFRLLAVEDYAAVEQIENLEEWLRGSLRNRIAAGGLCLVAFHKGRVAGFNLIAFGNIYIPLINLSRQFGPRVAWSEHIAVQKDFRQQRLASTLRYRIFDELRQRGIKRLYGGTLSSNGASLQLARRVGFRETVEIRYTRLLGVQTWRYERARN